MNGLTRVLSALLRLAARSLPAGRREWAEAAWAEATAVPAGRQRLAWLAGGLRLVAGQAGIVRRATCWLVFGAAVAGVIRVGWPGAAASPATLINRVDVIAVAVLLAGMPWASGRLFGPASGGRLARVLRAAWYSAILALVVVKVIVERFGYPPGRNYSQWDAGVLWIGEIIFLLVIATYAGGIIAVTARRRLAALSVGTAAGVAAGLVMYVRTHLHLTSPGLAAVAAATTVLTWVLMLGTPFAAGLLAARRTTAPDSREAAAIARPREGVAAGMCAGMAAALVVSALGTGTAALLPHQTSLVSWAYPARHLTHGSLYRYEVSVSQNAAIYLVVLLFFPLLGAGLGAWAGLAVAGQPGSRPSGGGGGGGTSAPPPAPPPPGGLARHNGHQPSLVRTGTRIIRPARASGSRRPEQRRPSPGRPEPIRSPSAILGRARFHA